eukprot:355862_1
MSAVTLKEVYPPPERLAEEAYVSSFKQYQEIYQSSIGTGCDDFWREKAESLDWFRKFDKVQQGSFQVGNIAWFLGGQLNAAYNCVDRHLVDKGDKIAIIWEGDTPDLVRRITYNELHEMVCRMANVLLAQGVRKGDPVCIYMPMIPEAAAAMLACARIGAPHSVVFAGFSAQALSDRILDCECKVVFTSDEGVRGGKTFHLKHIVDDALQRTPCVTSVLVWKRTGAEVNMKTGRDIWLADAMDAQRPYCPPAHMDSEDTLFMLYTSGSTGKPKGIAHSTAGYLLYTAVTHHYIFDYKPGDIFACVADIGWITGHSYIVYGPLCNGATTFMFESTPLCPDPGRYWSMVDRHKITQFYTAPTAIRAVQKFGDGYLEKYNLDSLRVLGTVGEPINPEAWQWYYEKVGKGKVPIVDTYWQTETGGFVITPFPGATALKPSSATFPFFGIDAKILDPKSGVELKGNGVEGVLCISRPWPGICRTIFGDHNRYLKTYMTQYPGYYFTGDGARRDKDGYLFITGRVDDVLNVSGHRIGTAEVEAAIGEHPGVVESAVIGIPHEIKGQTMFAFVLVKEGVNISDKLTGQIKLIVRQEIGPFASVEHVVISTGLPKTRSGKIMRRLLRKIATQDTGNLGDTSTLADSSVVKDIVTLVEGYYAKRKANRA